jgi:Na+-transporting NADH:ubiquinone oxidoreductase subunit NqrB
MPAQRAIRLDQRYFAPALITAVLLAGQLTFGFLESWTRTLLAIATAILVELVVVRALYGKWPHLASAYVSGISVGILVRSPAFWPYALCAAISITSKYVLRVGNRHIFNPTNFGIVMLLLLASGTVAGLSVQWGNNLLPMVLVWIFGTFILRAVGRLHITLTYVASFLVFAVIRATLTGHPVLAEIAPITGPMYQLFIFFMITDPKTTVRPKWAQSLVAVIIAALETVFRLMQWVYAPFYALFIVGPIANLIEIAIDRASTAPTGSSVGSPRSASGSPAPGPAFADSRAASSGSAGSSPDSSARAVRS